MGEIEIDKALPTTDAIEALDALLRAQYAVVYRGMMISGGKVRAQVTDAITRQESDAIRVYIVNFDTNTKTPEQTARATTLAGVRTVAQSAVGVAYGDLTAGQVKALLACLLFRVGAFNADGTVRPLSEWVK